MIALSCSDHNGEPELTKIMIIEHGSFSDGEWDVNVVSYRKRPGSVSAELGLTRESESEGTAVSNTRLRVSERR